MYVMKTNQLSMVGDMSEQTCKRLERDVRTVALPRHFWAQPAENRRAHDFLADEMSSLGYSVRSQGRYRNVIATPERADGPVTLVCAHYDSVATTPGADDNASGVAVILEVARRCAAASDQRVAFIGFNCEEDGLLGSQDFVEDSMSGLSVEGVHVLEMVGYSTSEPNSQRTPVPLPGLAPTVGDFLGVVGNWTTRKMLGNIVTRSRRGEGPKVVALQTTSWAHRLVPDLQRSDHAPFWQTGVPAVMWTDTAEFRNPNYHHESDTPDTLDYAFMARVANLLHSVVAGGVDVH